MRDMKSLIEEARVLSTQINRARFEGFMPSDDATVRLEEVLMIMEDLWNEENPDAMQVEGMQIGGQCYINGKPVSEEEFMESYK